MLYELPFGSGKPICQEGVAAAIFGGWQFGGVLRYQSGVPTTFCGAAGHTRVGPVHPVRPGRRPAGPDARGHDGNFDPFTDRQFNRAAFADPNAGRTGNQAFRLGNMPRTLDDARTWGYKNEDFSIIRNFRVREPVTFQLKAELLNAFNRHIFSGREYQPERS